MLADAGTPVQNNEGKASPTVTVGEGAAKGDPVLAAALGTGAAEGKASPTVIVGEGVAKGDPAPTTALGTGVAEGKAGPTVTVGEGAEKGDPGGGAAAAPRLPWRRVGTGPPRKMRLLRRSPRVRTTIRGRLQGGVHVAKRAGDGLRLPHRVRVE